MALSTRLGLLALLSSRLSYPYGNDRWPVREPDPRADRSSGLQLNITGRRAARDLGFDDCWNKGLRRTEKHLQLNEEGYGHQSLFPLVILWRIHDWTYTFESHSAFTT